MPKKLLTVHSNSVSGRVARVYRDPEYSEFVVRFYRPTDKGEQYLGGPSDYFTSERDDAEGTAAHFVLP